jgi:putative ABC transport system permease protein
MEWRDRIRAALASTEPPVHDDVVEELAQHASAMYEASRADGCSRDEAVVRVDDQIAAWRVDARRLRHPSRRPAMIQPPPSASSSGLSGLAHDARYAGRQLRRQPRHALLTILTMALGICATTVLFSITYGVLLRPLPWPNADRAVVLQERRDGHAPRFGAFTDAVYRAWHKDPATVAHLAAWSQRSATLSGAGEPERIGVTAASASLFAALGVHPLIGSLFQPEDETSAVVVLSESLWRQRFGADISVLGRAVQLDGVPYTVVGVLPDRFAYPDHQSRAIVPYAVPAAADSNLSVFNAIASLRLGATAAQASAEGTARGRVSTNGGLAAVAIFGSNGPVTVSAQPLRDALTAEVRQPLVVLLVGVFLLLATATANVASLQLARTLTRSRELAIRVALGAPSARVTQQLLVEGLVVGLTGGAVGLALTWLVHRSVPALLPADFPRIDDLGLNAPVVAFTVAVSIATSVAVGLASATRMRGLDLIDALADGGRAPVGTGMRSATARTRAFIMVGPVATACVLLVGASLLGRSFLALLTMDRGYDPAHILSARVAMPATLYPSAERRLALVDEILEKLATVPSLAEPAFTSELPLTPGGSTSAFTLAPRQAGGDVVRVQASPRIVSPRYFSALGIRLIAGRVLAESDTEMSEPVVLVNHTLAHRYLGAQPLGSKLPMAGYAAPGRPMTQSTVVGVVDDVRYALAAEPSQPEMYYSHRQMGGRLPVHTVTFLARTASDPGSAMAVRAAVRAADARLVADVILPLDERILTTLARPRLYATLLGGFAGAALLIAAVGLFGLLSYSVAQRSRELAIRTALGARPRDLFQLVLRQGLTVTGVGLLVGLLGSAWLVRLLSTQLYGVTPHDAVTFVGVPVLLVSVSVLACLLPAYRAARLPPQGVMSGGS